MLPRPGSTWVPPQDSSVTASTECAGDNGSYSQRGAAIEAVAASARTIGVVIGGV